MVVDAERRPRTSPSTRSERGAPAWPLTGRDDALDALTDLLEPLGSSPGVVLAGAPGVGKTRLAREAVATAGSRGATTRWAAATSSAASIPLGALAHLLPPLRPRPGSDRFQPLQHALEALRELAAGRPFVLGIDDAHLLDDASATLVHQIALSGVASVVLTLRSEEPAPDPITALWKDQLVARIEVARLSPTDLTELVSRVLDGPVEGATADRFWRLTVGNPLFLREVVLGALEADQLVERSGVWRWQGDFSPTSRLTELVRTRIGRLPTDERALVETVAFGEPLSASVATRLSSDEVLRRAERHGVVTVERDGRRWKVRMAHPVYAQVVKAECLPTRARDVQRALIAVQAEMGLRRRGDILRQATWQLDAEGTGDADLLVAAAAQANLVDPVVSERMARAARSSGGGFRAQLALGMALRCQGQANQAETVAAQAAAMASSDDQRAEAAAVLAQILFWDQGAADDAQAVLDNARPACADPAMSDGVIALSASFALFTGRPRAAIEMASSLVSSETAAGSAVVHASAVRSHALARCGCIAQSLEANQRGRAVMEHGRGDDVESVPARVDFTSVLTHAELTARRLAGALADVEQRALVFQEQCRTIPGGSRMVVARLLLGQVALARGRPMSAVRHLQAVGTELRERNGAWLYWSLVSLTEALALTGDPAAARTALTRAAAEHRASLRLWEPDLLLAEAWVLGTSGEVTQAVALAERAASTAAAMAQAAIEAVALHTCVRLGPVTPAVVSRLAELAGEVDSPLVAASSAHASALVAGDGAGLDRAAHSFAANGAALLAAEAARHAAIAHRAAGRRASELGSRQRAADLVATCEGARSPALERMPDEVTLTPREREVAGLAARGRSNRDIAERLVVSVRTVENHLDRVYAKLGLHKRADLAVALNLAPPGS